MRYYIWTEGCQMNIADSERMGSGLEQLGLEPAATPKQADVIVLNTCVVRQSAEDKAVGMLTSLKPWRQSLDQPDRILAVMGCMVGPQQDALRKRFPYVDTFMQPQQFEPLITLVGDKLGVDPDGCIPMLDGPVLPFAKGELEGVSAVPSSSVGADGNPPAPSTNASPNAVPLPILPFDKGELEGVSAVPSSPVGADGNPPAPSTDASPLEIIVGSGAPDADLPIPARATPTRRLLVPTNPTISTHVPIIHGCDKFCTFCIIPYRRGRETSRPINELVRECQMLVSRGVREVTLLGQNVDSYGHDLPGAPDLADLLEAVHDNVPELARIRFLTSHPNDMSQHIIDTVARLPRVMEYINLPFQAGNDRVLERMRRGYTNAQYREIVGRIRATVPNVAIVTDLIVGFPGETADEFEDTLAMVRDMRFDKVHVAAYSTRPNTIAQRQMPDDVPAEEKHRRLRAIEQLQEAILTDINAAYLHTTQEILVLGRKNGRLHGRTRTDKLVWFDAPSDWPGDRVGSLVQVRIDRTSPWSLQGSVVPATVPA